VSKEKHRRTAFPKFFTNSQRKDYFEDLLRSEATLHGGADPRNQNESTVQRTHGRRLPHGSARMREASDKTLIELKFCDACCAHASPRRFDSKKFVEPALTCGARPDSGHANIFAH
jgi:hypothetical protein